MGATSNPRVVGQLLPSIGEVSTEPFRVLLVGQIEGSGNAVDGQYYDDVETLTNAEIIALFGQGELTGRISKVRTICDQRFAISVIAKSAVAGTAASLAIVHAGTATETRTMTVSAISKKQYTFEVEVPNTTTANDFAALVQAKLDALDDYFPASSATVTATTTLTAKDSGTLGNKFTVEYKNIPAGLTVNTNASYSRMQFGSGATDPTLTGIFDNVEATRFHAILWPWESNFTEVQDFLEPRLVVNNAVLQGVAFIGFDGTQAEIKAKVNGTTPLNSSVLCFAGNRQVSGASVIIEPPDYRLAEFIAIEGLRLTEDAAIGQYVTVDAALDTIGGPALASLGYYNTPLPNTTPETPDDLFDGAEQVSLKDDGYTIIGVNTSKTSMIMGEVVTTYKFDTIGNEDVSFKYLNYVRTGYLALELFVITMKARYSQSRLVEGDLIAGRAMANKESITGSYLDVYRQLASADYVLTQAGKDAETYFLDNLDMSTDLTTGKVTSLGDLPIVTQIRDFIMSFRMSFTIGG